MEEFSYNRWISIKSMPAVKMGNTSKFMLNEVDEWIRFGESSN